MNSIERNDAAGRWWRAAAIVLCLVAIASLAGCVTKWPQREGIVRSNGVYVFHAPGISGPIPYDFAFAKGLIQGGVEEVRPIDWQSWSVARNLSDEELHETAARRLVETLRGFHTTSPDARIVLTAHSGGGLIVIRAVELLNDNERFVEQIWLLAASISPDYDFSRALRHVDRIVAVSSTHDWFILGAGTRTFGTSDGDRTDSGGRVGFTEDDPHFEHWTYDSSWLALGNAGDHLTVLSRRFARWRIAPAILRWLPSTDDRDLADDAARSGAASGDAAHAYNARP